MVQVIEHITESGYIPEVASAHLHMAQGDLVIEEERLRQLIAKSIILTDDIRVAHNHISELRESVGLHEEAIEERRMPV